MRRILLDTCAYTALVRGHAEIAQAQRRAREIYLTPVVLGELAAGFRHGNQRQKNEAVLAELRASSRVRVLVIDEETADCYAEILLTLRRAGNPIPTNDLWIAASAMQHGLVVLTTDEHFDHVPQVRVARFAPDSLR
jgi:predicted nucleic acid-binding protein